MESTFFKLEPPITGSSCAIELVDIDKSKGTCGQEIAAEAVWRPLGISKDLILFGEQVVWIKSAVYRPSFTTPVDATRAIHFGTKERPVADE